MNLVIFDIDGTLLNTNRIDGACFNRAMEIEFGVISVNREWWFGDLNLGRWDTYPHITDSGLTREIFRRGFGRDPDAEEVHRFIGRYVSLMEESYRASPDHFSQIPGAGNILSRLANTPDWKIGIATGGWFALATFKLKCAGISTDGIPLSTSDDAESRKDIVRACIARAQQRYEVDPFSRIVSIGDGPWDVKTAIALGIPFLGVGDPQRLSQEGAAHTIRDYSDPDGFFSLLEKARVPASK